MRSIFHTLHTQILEQLFNGTLKNIMYVVVYLTFFFFFFQKKALGKDLLEQVFYHLDIIEKDYFGLQFTDPYNVPHWLDPTKLVKKQVKSKCCSFISKPFLKDFTK